MRVVSWNVNGLRAILKKADVISKIIKEQAPDILCLQETKCPESFDAAEVGSYFAYSKIVAPRVKKGYSGVAIFSKTPPISDTIFEEGVAEGRVIALEFAKFWLVNVYTPNSKQDLSRLDYRVNVWEPAFRAFLKRVGDASKPVIVVGDLNVAPGELDLHNPKANVRSHGFTAEERGAFAELLNACDLVDAYRRKYPSGQEYTWFSPFARSRERNKGWRIDHILVSSRMKTKNVKILGQYTGSDHIPVLLEI